MPYETKIRTGGTYLHIATHGDLGVTILKCIALETALREKGKMPRPMRKRDKRSEAYDATASAFRNYFNCLHVRARSCGLDPIAITSKSERVIAAAEYTLQRHTRQALKNPPVPAVPELPKYVPGKPRVDAFGTAQPLPVQPG